MTSPFSVTKNSFVYLITFLVYFLPRQVIPMPPIFCMTVPSAFNMVSSTEFFYYMRSFLLLLMLLPSRTTMLV